ncbi:MAG TPA: hypothetical protein VIH00_13385, partial [Candidatus Limnocylindrales bacterium]
PGRFLLYLHPFYVPLLKNRYPLIVICYGRIERGEIAGMPLEVLVRVAAVLGARLDVSLRWNGEALDRLLDEDHATIVDALVGLYRAAGWEVAVEASFAIAGERGSIDVLAYQPSLRLVAVNEVKSVVPDAQATIHTHDRKSRLALAIAAQRGWDADRVARFLVIGESRTSRRRVEAHASLFGAAYPVRGRAAVAWIRSPTREPVSGLFFLSPAHGVGRKTVVAGRHRVRLPRSRSADRSGTTRPDDGPPGGPLTTAT